MDSQRLFLYCGTLLLLLVIWQQWQVDYGTPATPAAVDQAEALPGSTDDSAVSSDTPVVSASGPSDALPDLGQVSPEVESAQYIRVLTDTFDLLLSVQGGTIANAKLREYSVSIEQPDVPLTLLQDDPENLFIAQSGLLSNASAPDHKALYRAERESYTLDEDQDELRVPLVWEDGGIRVVKTLTFKRGQYEIEVAHRVENSSDAPWSGRAYQQLQRRYTSGGGSWVTASAYEGGVISTPEDRYQKLSVSDMQESNLQQTAKGGWVALIERYFLAVWVPEPEEIGTYYSKALPNDRYILGQYTEPVQVEVGSSHTLRSQVYVGPKIQSQLNEVAPNLYLTVDYGLLSILANPLFFILKWIHDNIVSNWGVAIMLTTLLIKLCFYKLSEMSYRSMARMRRLHPEMVALRERYADDKAQLGRETMALYKRERVNPLGGCLPVLLQIPVFIALYWVLLESVELRQAPFFGWIQDLSVRDPYFVLPVLMGISMWVQQKLNPTPTDPMQAKIFMMMPFVFTIFFFFFPAGLVLYWVTNNVLSLLQQYYITFYVVGDRPRRT